MLADTVVMRISSRHSGLGMLQGMASSMACLLVHESSTLMI